jgi:hypothetical protein
MFRTNTYRFGYYPDGGTYSSSLDRTRFFTLEYNLGTYIGIVGNGIIKGWEIAVVSGKTVKVTPGSGFIDGFYSETGYWLDSVTRTPKKRSRAQQDGDDIVEEIPGWSSENENWWGMFYTLGGSPPENALVLDKIGPDGEDSNYDGLTDGVLTPHYKKPPDNFLIDPFVKAVPQSYDHLILADNSDNYVYAARAGTEPSSTFAKFSSSVTPTASESKVLVARVTVRGGAVVGVDYSSTFRLSGFEGVTMGDGQKKIVQHHHGGTQVFDPPKVKLDTDMRKTYLYSYSDLKATFRSVPNNATAAALDHRHYYDVDSSGNGYTFRVVGDYAEHYHIISGNVTTSIVSNYGSDVPDHTHDIAVDEQKLWEDGDRVNVYVNGKLADPSTYSLDSVAGTVTFAPGKIDVLAPIYDSSFKVAADGEMYSFKQEGYSLSKFFLNMTSDFYDKYRDRMATYVDAPDGTQTVRDPFTFYQSSGQDVEIDPHGNVVATPPLPIYADLPTSSSTTTTSFTTAALDILPFKTPLDQQVTMALDALRTEGSSFTFLPYLAKFVPVTLVRKAYVDTVLIEIVRGEVTGILRSQNIFFVKSEKFTEGTIEPVRLPLLNHTGRLNEAFSPSTIRLDTENGVEFFASPDKLDASQGHSHQIYVDRTNNGTTLDTLVNDQITVWVDVNGTPTQIEHFHEIKNGVVSDVVSEGVNSWQGQTSTATHTHSLPATNMGNSMSVFCVAEDSSGNLYLGTSQGLAVVPVAEAYKMSVNYVVFYDYNTTASDAVAGAIARYSDDTGLTVSSEYQDYIAEAEMVLSGVGGSYLFPGETPVTIERVTYAMVDDFYADSVKPPNQISSSETIIREVTVQVNTGSLQSLIDVYGPLSNQVIQAASDPDFLAKQEPILMYKVRDDFRNDAVWSLDIKDGKVYATIQRGVVIGSHGSTWGISSMPTGSVISRSSVKFSGGDCWTATNTGLAVSRIYDNNSSFSFPNKNLQNSEVYGIVENGPDQLIACSDTGIWSVSDLGATVTMVSSTIDAYSLSRDFSADITSTVASHYHTLDVDAEGNGFTKEASSGTPHVHAVSGWVVETALAHTHSLVTTVYALTQSGNLMKSSDSGQTWSVAGSLTFGYSEANGVNAAFGKLYVPADTGLWMSGDDGATWSLLSVGKFWSSGWAWDFRSFYLSSDGAVMVFNASSEPSTFISFSGNPYPIVYSDGAGKAFNYAYNNMSKKFFMRHMPSLQTRIEATLSYNVWFAEKGPWDSSKPYDIYVNGKRMLSAKDGIDRMGEYGVNFSVDAASAKIDFSFSTSLAGSIAAGDEFISVASSAGIPAGSTILVESEDGDIKGVVESVSGTSVYLADAIGTPIQLPASVSVLSSLASGSTVSASIYESDLYNVGTKTHEEIEDGLADLSIGMPAKMEDTYLNNLSETTIAVKYALPAIDERLKKWMAYMMNYGRAPSDPNYIGKVFDVETTQFNSRVTYSRAFAAVGSNSVNAFLFGYGDLDGLVFAATNSGLFYAKKFDNLEGNWIPVVGLAAVPAYDMLIVEGKNLLVATLNGLWGSDNGDITRWIRRGESITGDNSAYFITPRWVNFESSTQYWWNTWQQTSSTLNPNISNDLMAGGKGWLMKSYDGGLSWIGLRTATKSSGSVIELSEDYYYETLCPTSDGRALLAANSKLSGGVSYIIAMTDVGDTMEILEEFTGYKGNILSVAATDANNTALGVSFAVPNSDPAVKDNSLIGLQLVAGNTQWHIATNIGNTITVFGEEAGRLLREGMSFGVVPVSIRKFLQTRDSRILVGTSTGMVEDEKSYFGLVRSKGTIAGVNKTAIVNSIDTSGTVISLSRGISQVGTVVTDQNGNESSVLGCVLDRIVAPNELAGQTLRVVSGSSPSIAVLSPVPNQNVSSSSVAVRVSVTSFDVRSSGYIVFQMDGGTTIYARTTSHTFQDLPNGSHTVKVWLANQQQVAIEGRQTSQQITFETSPVVTEPSVSIQYPVGTVLTPNITAIVALSDFTPADGKMLYSVDGLVGTNVPFTQSGNIQISLLNLAQGDHSLKIWLTDLNGNSIGATDEERFTVSVTTDAIIQITSPTSGSYQTWNSVNLAYSISNFSVPEQGSVQIYLNGTYVATSQSATVASLSNLPNGANHKLKAVLVDSNNKQVSGNYSSAEITLTIDTTVASVKAVHITSPTSATPPYSSGVASVQLQYATDNFDIPDAGGVVITVDGGISVFTNTNPTSYNILNPTDGTHNVVVTLATDANTKLTNPEATANTTFVVGTATRSVAAPSTMSLSPIATPFAGNSAKDIRAVDDNSSSSSTEGKEGFRIVSNSASAGDGATSITLDVTVDDSMISKTVKIIANTTRLFVSFEQPVKTSEFNGGVVYVDPLDPVNGGKQYDVDSNTTNYVSLMQSIDELEAMSSASGGDIPDVMPGQRVIFVPSSGKSTLWIDPSAPLRNNSLAGETITIDHSDSAKPSIEATVAENTSKSIVLDSSVSPKEISPGDTYAVTSVIFTPLESFAKKKTSTDLDHYHDTDLVNRIVSGKVASMSLASAALVDVYVYDTNNFDLSIIQSNPTLLQGAKIIFQNPNEKSVIYEEIVDSVSTDKITVRVSNTADWNLNGSNSVAISAGFTWEIDTFLYGLTSAVHYDDFVVFEALLMADGGIGDTDLSVSSVSGVLPSDKVDVFDSSGSVQSAMVQSVSGLVVSLDAPLDRTYLMSMGASIRIRRNVYLGPDNDHVHVVRGGEVYFAYLPSFRDLGYPDQHSHILSDLLSEVDAMISDEAGSVTVAGAGSSIMYSSDLETTWHKLVDVNDVREGADEATGVGCLVFDENNMMTAGVKEGYVVAQCTEMSNTSKPIEVPEMEMSSSSSSESSSDSSVSSRSTYSSYSSASLSSESSVSS